MDLAGEIFRKKREDLGLDILEISNFLRIKADYIRAIEGDLFERLPASVYTIGYIKCYAKYLELEAGPVVRCYTDYCSRHLPRQDHAPVVPVSFFKKRGSEILYIIPLLLLMPVIFISFRRMPDERVEKAMSTPDKAYPRPPADAAATALPQGNATPGQSEHSLEIIANDTTWLYIKFKDGKTEEILIQPGNSKSWKFSEKAFLKIGNAGGIKIYFDGKDIGTPGDIGQVKTLSLPDNLKL